MTTAIVLGGGVIGLSTAYHLARKGAGKVLLLEKGEIGDGSSRRAAGIITGLLWSDTGILARRRSLELFHGLADDLPGYRFQDVGCLNLFDPAGWRERAPRLADYARLGAPYEVLNAAEIRRRWPELTPDDDIVGLFDPLGGYSEPDAYIPALTRRIRDLGVEIHEQCPVTDLVVQGGRVVGVETPTGRFTADAVVSTLHVWTPPLLARLGWRVPMKSFVHQRYVTNVLDRPVQIPAINANPQGGYIRPAAGNRLLAGGETAWREEVRVTAPDFAMSTLEAPPSVKAELTAQMGGLWPRLAGTRWEEERVGLIAFSLDGEPILGPAPGLPGLYLGCAFHSGGFAYNPVAGELLAEFVVDGAPKLDVTAFAPDRFVPGEVEGYLAQTVSQAHAVRRRH